MNKGMTNEQKEAYKLAFLEAEKANRDKLGVVLCENQYSPTMLTALKEMASHCVFPDGRFGDMDVAIWEMFRW